MPNWKAIKTRLTRWEFWPFWFLYIPVFVYYAWLALRERSFFFFTSSNPSIEFGGMLGEKKSDIFKLIPDEYYPKTILIGENREELLKKAGEIGFPLIAKPDIGERGDGVELIHNEDELITYSEKMNVDFLLQELVDYPVELGVFYIRHPDQEKGRVTSIVAKDFLKVTGDGSSSVEELLRKKNRALIQLNWDHPRFEQVLTQIPTTGQTVVIEPIGNHCRGTTFLNANEEIDNDLNNAIDRLAKEIPEFHFGRFDIRCRSFDDLRKLEHFKILELNGAGAEPGHIYQPGYSLIKAYKEICWHLDQLASVSRANKHRGFPYWSLRRGVRKFLDIRAYNRRLRTS